MVEELSGANRLRVAMVAACPFPANRGTPSRIKGMAEALARRGHQIDVFTYHHGLDVQTHGIEVYRTPKIPYRYLGPGPTFSKLMLLDPLLTRMVAKKLRTQRYDLIHAHHFEGALISYLANRGLKLPVIYDAHTRLDSELESYRFPSFRGLSKTLDRKVPAWSDRVIAVSDDLRNTLTNDGLDSAKIDVVVTGADLSVFDACDTGSIRRDLDLEDRKIVIYTGSLDKFQQVELLVESMAKVILSEPRAILLIVAGLGRPEFQKHIDKYGLQNHVAMVVESAFDKVPQYLAAADVAVLPRVDCPGIPQKLVNYMGAGKAIVSFAGSAKLLTHNVDALVADNGNTDEMAAHILRFLDDEDLRRRFGDCARKTVSAPYDWAVLAERIESIYRDLLTKWR